VNVVAERFKRISHDAIPPLFLLERSLVHLKGLLVLLGHVQETRLELSFELKVDDVGFVYCDGSQTLTLVSQLVNSGLI